MWIICWKRKNGEMIMRYEWSVFQMSATGISNPRYLVLQVLRVTTLCEAGNPVCFGLETSLVTGGRVA